MDGPPLRDGAVAIQDHTIVACAPFAHLEAEFTQAEVVDHPQSVLMPGLVNAHIHLELSNLAYLAQGDLPASFSGWIAEMLQERESLGVVGSHVEAAAQKMLTEQYDSGVLVLADIGNTNIGGKLAGSFPGTLFPFLEYLGLSKASLGSALKKLAKTDEQVACTAHASYSTHPELIRALKQRADRLGQLFPLHVAEPESESSLLDDGSGEMAEFLKKRGFYEDVFTRGGQKKSSEGAVAYLHRLGILNSRTLCVHAVHVSEDEIELLQKSQANVCLCPGSNRFLQVGKAPVSAYLRRGILPALGTDSAASNPCPSLWSEMSLLAEDHPGVAPHDILRMATLGGALALGVENRYGALASGRVAHFLSLPLQDDPRNAEDLCAALVSAGPAAGVQWIGS